MRAARTVLLLIAAARGTVSCAAPLETPSAPTPATQATRSTRTVDPTVADGGRLGDGLRVERIAPGAWLVVDEQPIPANSLLVEAADGTLVLCSSPYTADTAAPLVEWVRSTFGERRMIVVNTHFHPDALGGNATFAASGAETWGSDRTAALLAERGERVRAQVLGFVDGDPVQTARFRSARFTASQHRFPLAEGTTFRLGTELVEVIFPGPAHAPDNVVVWFPARGILFGGCMVLAGGTPGNTVDAELASWPASVARLRELPARVVVTGHGPVGGPALLGHTLEVLQHAKR